MYVYILLSVFVCLVSLYFLHGYSRSSECVILVSGESFKIVNCAINSDLVELSRTIKPGAWDCL
nr:triple gene block protein 3 [Chrysanthemum virus R]